MDVALAWKAILERMLKAREFEDVVIREDYEFQMPLNTKLDQLR